MRILQLCDKPHDFVKGFDLVEEIARAFAGTEHKFIYGVLSGVPDAELENRIAGPVKLFHFAKKKLKPTSLSTLWQIIRYIRANQIDVVITHRFKPWLLLAAASFLLPRCQFVSVFHAFKQFDRKRRQLLAQIFLSERWHLIAVSDAVRTDLVAHNIPAERITVIRNAIDIAGVRAAQMPRTVWRDVERRLPTRLTRLDTRGWPAMPRPRRRAP